MSQAFQNDTERLRFTASSALTVDTVLEVEDIVGMLGDDVANGDNGILFIDQSVVVQPAQQVVTEAWAAGQQLYWNQAAGRVTSHQTHQRFGIAAKAKAASATVEGGAAAGHRVLVRPHKVQNLVQYTVNMADFPEVVRTIGDIEIIDFGQTVHVDSATVYTVGDDSLLPGTTTISLGDGTGSNDQVVAAAAASTYSDTVATDVSPANAQITKLVMRIAVADFTAGWLKIDVAYTPIG